MKQFKMFLTLILVLALSTVMFAGCGKTEETESQVTEEAVTEAEEVAEESSTEVTEEAEEVAEPVKSPEDYEGKVVVWLWDTRNHDATIEGFNAMYPNIEVEVVVVDSGDYLQKTSNKSCSRYRNA